MDLESNLQRMKRPWNQNEPIGYSFAQVNTAVEYGIFTNNPYSGAKLVNAGEISVLQT